MPIPTIDVMEITPQFIKDHIFLVVLVGDTAFTGFFNFTTGSNFHGIVGYIISFVLGSVINFATGSSVEVRVDTWQIFFLFFLIQSGLLKLVFDMLIARFSGRNK